MERAFHFVPGQYYHVFNRGVEKRAIFQDRTDWERFRNLLYLCNSQKALIYKLIQGDPLEWERGETITSMVAYALMPNHFHIIAREDEDGGLSKFLSKVTTSYSMYFNTKYERSGPLMNRPFRARHITNDEYFRWVISYVHLNPLSPGISDREYALRTYDFSSYVDYYVGERQATKIINRSALPIGINDLEQVDEMLGTQGIFQGDPLE
jgi:REP element-mobilizing transposase RayT